jgi:glycerate 2-kinase
MVFPERFLTSTLRKNTNGKLITRILTSAFNSVEPGAAVKNYLRENELPLTQRVFAFGLGKAACAMTQAVADEINLTDALVITKHASPLTFETITVIEGNHPVPGEASISAGLAAMEFISQLTPDDLLICLISGGGSALMTAPRVPLADLQSLTSALLACGARIDEINILRRHLDSLKGGGLVSLAAARGPHIVSLILSDVVDDSLATIASGPTAPDATTCADVLFVIQKYTLLNKIPNSIVPSLYETLKPNDPAFANVQNIIIASNNHALFAAQAQAQVEGLQVNIINMGLQGEAGVVGREIAFQLKESLQTMQRPFCLLAGGETTVTINGKGKGGRNQELALVAVDILAGLKDIIFISLATDGEDGPTDAAGAVVTGESAHRAESLGMSAADYLSRNDAYSFFQALNDLIRTGPSGTNVNDLILCFAF